MTGVTDIAWNIDYDETVLSQDLYIENTHKFWGAFITEFAGGAYDARVDCSYEVINLSRTTGYAETSNGGVHPIQAGYEELGVGMALAFNKLLKTN